MTSRNIHQELADAAWDMACQRAEEEGDVDIDYDYTIMEAWTTEYYKELCKEEGIEPDPRYSGEE